MYLSGGLPNGMPLDKYICSGQGKQLRLAQMGSDGQAEQAGQADKVRLSQFCLCQMDLLAASRGLR